MKYYDFANLKVNLVRTFEENEGEITLACLIADGIVFVEDRRNIKIIDLSTGQLRHFLGTQKDDIMAMGIGYIVGGYDN